MKNADYYAPGTYSDPNAPWNQEDPTESAEFEAEQLNQWNDRIMDVHGYFLESLSERPTADLKKLARMVRDNQNHSYSAAIGGMITQWVLDYCKPSDDDVLEVLNEEPYDPEV